MVDGRETRLGVWLKDQRYFRSKNMLRPDREAKLQKLVDEGKLSWLTSQQQGRHSLVDSKHTTQTGWSAVETR